MRGFLDAKHSSLMQTVPLLCGAADHPRFLLAHLHSGAQQASTMARPGCGPHCAGSRRCRARRCRHCRGSRPALRPRLPPMVCRPPRAAVGCIVVHGVRDALLPPPRHLPKRHNGLYGGGGGGARVVGPIRPGARCSGQCGRSGAPPRACQTPSSRRTGEADAAPTSYGLRVGRVKPSPQSILSLGQAICTHASTPCDSAASLGGETSAGTGGKGQGPSAGGVLDSLIRATALATARRPQPAHPIPALRCRLHRCPCPPSTRPKHTSHQKCLRVPPSPPNNTRQHPRVVPTRAASNGVTHPTAAPSQSAAPAPPEAAAAAPGCAGCPAAPACPAPGPTAAPPPQPRSPHAAPPASRAGVGRQGRGGSAWQG